MISVEIPPKERGPGQTNKVYTYSDLKELQGKLMLVAGKAEKGKEDVDGFVEVIIHLLFYFIYNLIFLFMAEYKLSLWIEYCEALNEN